MYDLSMGWRVDNWFSNFKPLDEPFWDEGIKYRTVEAYFQSQKTLDLEQRAKIAAMSPRRAKQYCSSRANNFTLRPDWDTYRHKVMEFALRKKFAHGTSWHRRLMETKGEIIEWTTWGDRYWGKDATTGEGENHLGRLLMKLRDEYRRTQSPS